jgi:phosphoribosyl 1,2-cyclic phosphodiesterase
MTADGPSLRCWGARGSIPAPGPATQGFGGNTSCLELTTSDGSRIILDAGTGIRELGATIEPGPKTIDILLTHLHLDHIQGLMFFAPLFDPEAEIHIYGPASLGRDLLGRLARYISAPLTPIEIRELPARVSFHDVGTEPWSLGPARIEAGFVNHRGPTLGYRITDADTTIVYIPDHEPALGPPLDRVDTAWLSGAALAGGADLLIHDAQYTDAEYRSRVGWGHSALSDALAFARRVDARRLALFHHDPSHEDAALEQMEDEARSAANGAIEDVSALREGDVLDADHLGSGCSSPGQAPVARAKP